LFAKSANIVTTHKKLASYLARHYIPIIMILPIPTDTQNELLFEQTCRDMRTLVGFLGDKNTQHASLGHVTPKGRFQYQKTSGPIADLGPFGAHFMHMHHAIPCIIAFHKQTMALHQAEQHLPESLVDTALRIATHEILDNNHAQIFTPRTKTPLYDIASLAIDMVNGALNGGHDTLNMFYDNCDALIAESYYMRKRYARVMRNYRS
jgi:hypothetical protein